MSVKNQIASIIISLLVAVTFMPITGQGVYADELQNVFNAGGKVAGLTKSAAAYNSVTIKWTPYSGASGYEIYRADKKKGKYKKIKTLSSCSYKDKGNKKLGKNKYYKVRAYATVNSKKVYSAYSSILAAKPKLATPTAVTSSGGSGKITIKWNKVSGAKGYQVYRATSKTGKYTRFITTGKKTYTNTSVTTGKKYFYKVRAYRKSGGKKYSSFTSPIEGMAKLNGAGGFTVKIAADGTVTNSWSKVTGASGYQVQRATSANGTYVSVGETTATSKQDKLTNSGQYYYRVRAYSTVNGKKQYGDFSAGGRTNAVTQARSWVGCKESNGTHKKIIDVYNGVNPKSGKIGYGTSWCAAFVSAVAIKTGNTGIIPVDCYCPRMLTSFAKTSKNKSYTPQGGDVVFFDWNYNKVPDHVGMVESVSGSSVTTIEGNYSDAVKRRTFKKGYSLLLAYGLPNYSVSNVVSFTAPETTEDEVITEATVTEADIESACAEIQGTSSEPGETSETEASEQTPAVTDPAEENAAQSDDPAQTAPDEEKDTAQTETEPAVTAEAAEETTDEAAAAVQAATETETAEALTQEETAEKIIDYIQEETPAEDAAVDESKFNAFLVYGICDEMDIDACVVTVTEQDGSESSYNEVVLDGEMYILNATEEGGVLEKYTPEEIN